MSRILIPQQVGGSDTCDITNEEEMVAYQDEHDLITLGWIHVGGEGDEGGYMWVGEGRG